MLEYLLELRYVSHSADFQHPCISGFRQTSPGFTFAANHVDPFVRMAMFEKI